MSRIRPEGPTVLAHIEAGLIAPAARVSVDALYQAAEWCESYEVGTEDAVVATHLATVAAYLRKEAERRESNGAIKTWERALSKALTEQGYNVADPKVVAKIKKVARERA